MFNRLPESNAPRQRRTGGFAVSTVLHLVVIALAVRATTGTAARVERPTQHVLVFRDAEPARPRESPPPAAARPRGGGLPTRPSRNVLPVIDPIDIPSTIPDPGAIREPVTSDDFGRPGGIVAAGPAGDVPSVAGGSPLAEHLVDRAIVALPGTTPRYPSMLQSAGVEGDVRAQFVVDTLGRVERGSVRIIQSTHDLFSQAVRDALARARFVPAEAGGRKVRQLAEQVFMFNINRD